MPWVRIDENAMDHPKIGGLSDGAFRLWVQGLAYCQKFLTDGRIVTLALRGLRAYSAKRTAALVQAGLWQTETDGVQVHDYLDWNDSRERVLNARQCSRERMAKLRGGSREVTGTVRDSPPSLHSTPPPVRTSRTEKTPARERNGLVFKGERLRVTARMQEWLIGELGAAAGHVDLEACYREWDAQRPIDGVETLDYLKACVKETVRNLRRGGPMFQDPAPSGVWGEVYAQLEARVPRHALYTWFRPLRLEDDQGDLVVLLAPSPMHAGYLERNYGPLLSEAIEAVRPGARLELQTEPEEAPA